MNDHDDNLDNGEIEAMEDDMNDSVEIASPSPPADQLERCGSWLSSIPRDDVIDLRLTQEYRDFLLAFDRLGQAHRRVISMNRVNNSSSVLDLPSYNLFTRNIHATLEQFFPIDKNFLQHSTSDDVILRIFEFLECHSLIQMCFTCSRMKQLAYRSAKQRTYDVAITRQLRSAMQLLRAKEQIDGVGNGIHDNHVRVPILLLSRRILVTNSGDPEYNGLYFCTGSNGNGFVFTKPRFPERRVHCRVSTTVNGHNHRRQETIVNGITTGEQPPVARIHEANFHPPNGAAGVAQEPIGEDPASRFESEMAQPGQLLRCVIAKRFSNETILWYFSKEVEPSETQAGAVIVGEITQVFSFWAKLMVIGDASPDICRYPSQSSILAHHGEGWRSLSATRHIQPPTVELLD